MRKFLFSIAIALSMSVHAQGVDSMFVNMPDSIFPYLSSAQRKELINLKRVDMATAAVLQSAFNCKVALQYLDAERMTLTLDSVVTIELASPKSDGALACCVLRTVPTPEPHTSAVVYDAEWNVLKRLDLDSEPLTERNDTMSAQRYEELCKLIEFPLVEAHFENASTIELTLNVPMVSKEERKKLEAILVKRKLRWDGVEYK